MVARLIREVHAALIESRMVKVSVAGYEFSMTGAELLPAAIRELHEHAAAWAVIARDGDMPYLVPLVPGVLIDDELFVNLPCSFLLAPDLNSCLVRIGDTRLAIYPGNNFTSHDKTGYMLWRTKEEAEEACVPSKIVSW